MGDLISQLPNDLLHKVLLNLTTSESVRTSALSTRWRHLWQTVPGLIFDGDERDALDFTDRFLNLHKESPIYKFTIMCSRVDIPRWKLLIDQVLTRQVQFLKINGLRRFKLPVRFYMCETLINLHLVRLKLDDFDGSEFINLPRLQVMHLDSVSIPSDVVLEMFISCSPVLQELILCNMTVKRVKVRSQTLKSLSLSRIRCRVVIDTPNLEFMSIRDNPLKNLRVESVGSSFKICTGAYGKDDFSNMQTLHNFFTGFSRVTDLSISSYTLYGIYITYLSGQQHQQLPEFKNLTRLYACFYASYSKMLPLFLSSCPNLKSIALELHGYLDMKEITNLPVPECLQRSIENVKIKRRKLMGDKERSPKLETEFAKYILENAKALKKLTLWLDDEEDVCRNILEQILTFRDRPSVDVMIHGVTSNCRTGYQIVTSPCQASFQLRLTKTTLFFLLLISISLSFLLSNKQYC